MKKNCNKITSCSYWFLVAVIIYLISMLVYITIDFFKDSKPFQISDFGSILSGVSTLFTGLVALYVFSNWKSQNIKLFFKDEAQLLYSKISQLDRQSEEIEDILSKAKILQYLEKGSRSLDPIEKYKLDMTKFIDETTFFSDFSDDESLILLIQTIKTNLKDYKKFFEDIESNASYPYGGDFITNERSKRKALDTSINELKKCFKTYILLKKN